MNTIAIAFVCAILIATQHTASAINCYSCGTGADGCSNTAFSKTGHGVTATTDSSYAYCYKYTYSSNSNAASRSVGATSGSCPTTGLSGTSNGVAYTITCCSSELCNGAEMTGMNLLLALGAATIGLYFAK